jgi:hypothetical protein
MDLLPPALGAKQAIRWRRRASSLLGSCIAAMNTFIPGLAQRGLGTLAFPRLCGFGWQLAVTACLLLANPC